MRRTLIFLFGLFLTCADLWAAPRDLTFFLVSDTHYGLSAEGDKTIPKLIEAMNQLPGNPYPAGLGGRVGKPSGVLHTGDITNSAKPAEWDMFVRDYGLRGGDGRLAYPVYETFGNHDGGEKNCVRKGIYERNKTRPGLTRLSENGLHYSWDWQGVHFISGGISPGTTCHPYDPAHSIEFINDDLAKNVGTSGKPVILMHHFGFDKGHSLGWWSEEWRTDYYNIIRPYNVIGILHGHAHTSFIYKWQGIDIYHPPHFRGNPKRNEPVTHGFFVFHITDSELTVAERKLDGTWGLTSRKSLAVNKSPQAASPTR